MAQGKYVSKGRKRQSGGSSIVIILVLLLAFLTTMMVIRAFSGADPTLSDPSGKDPVANSNGDSLSNGDSSSGGDSGSNNDQPVETTTVPTEPYIVSTASVGVTGDILMHGPVIRAGAIDGSYDFTDNYMYIADYYKQYDMMVANLEVTLGGPEAGEYQGYPTFNCPDNVIDALKNAGVDMILTANNHTYDTGYKGMMRTQQVIREKGLLHLGTIESTDDTFYQIHDLNGIKVGMVCYTYETGKTSDGRKTLNGIALSADASKLVCSFDYKNLDAFYEDVAQTLQKMSDEGADVSMLYIHWGDEYHLKPNKNQQAIAQQLCELGVDIIVGGHPHVIEPFETLTSSSGNTTYCIYSLGNAISNQNRNSLEDTTENARYTEDGMIFGAHFQKWNDGRVEIAEIKILPTWVNKEWKEKQVYNIIPLDTAVPVWNCYDVGTESRTYESYKRTMSILGEGYNACREALGLEPVPMTFGEE